MSQHTSHRRPAIAAWSAAALPVMGSITAGCGGKVAVDDGGITRERSDASAADAESEKPDTASADADATLTDATLADATLIDAGLTPGICPVQVEPDGGDVPMGGLCR